MFSEADQGRFAVVSRSEWEVEWNALFYAYRWVTARKALPGYEEVRRLHGEEMKALGWDSAAQFCARRVESAEVLFRVGSVASWMECQESFTVWLVRRDFRGGWRVGGEERARAVAALYVSRLHRTGRVARVCRGYGGREWSAREWRNILRQAEDLTEKKFECSELDRWLWWVFPVCRRYRWNTRELQDAACERGFRLARELSPEIFRRRMMTMGLRLQWEEEGAWECAAAF